MRLRFTISMVETLAISAVAIITPATGETVRPIEAENCMGKMMELVSAPSPFDIFGTKGPKAKNEALPLPISIEAKNIMTDITMPIPIKPKPAFWAKASKPSINPKLIKPLANISAVMIRVTTVLKILPIPFQKILSESKTSFRFLFLKPSKIRAVKRLINMAVVVSNVIGSGNKLNNFEKTINKIIGKTGMMAYIKGVSNFSSSFLLSSIGLSSSIFRSKYLLTK